MTKLALSGLLGLIVLAGASFCSGKAVAEEIGPLGHADLAPYRVMVRVTFAVDPSVTPAFRQAVTASLTVRIGQTFGEAWTLLPADRAAVVEDDELTPADETGLARLTSAAVAEMTGAAPCDKAYLLVVRSQGPKWIVAGREWDHTLESLGPILTSATFDRRAIADAAIQVIERLYSPLLIVNDADRNSNSVHLTVAPDRFPWAIRAQRRLKRGRSSSPSSASSMRREMSARFSPFRGRTWSWTMFATATRRARWRVRTGPPWGPTCGGE